jgi:hypothetical protein
VHDFHECLVCERQPPAAGLDPAVPIEETVGAIADLIKAGYDYQMQMLDSER